MWRTDTRSRLSAAEARRWPEPRCAEIRPLGRARRRDKGGRRERSGSSRIFRGFEDRRRRSLETMTRLCRLWVRRPKVRRPLGPAGLGKEAPAPVADSAVCCWAPRVHSRSALTTSGKRGKAVFMARRRRGRACSSALPENAPGGGRIMPTLGGPRVILPGSDASGGPRSGPGRPFRPWLAHPTGRPRNGRPEARLRARQPPPIRLSPRSLQL